MQKIRSYSADHTFGQHFCQHLLLLLFLLASLLLSACAGQGVQDPILLEQAKNAAISNTHLAGLAGQNTRVKAALMPESNSLLKIFKGDMALIGIYRNYSDGGTRFALSMPQGTRMGSCVREVDGKMLVQSISPFALMVGMVRSSFAALDNLYMSPPKIADSWHLQNGDIHAGVKRSSKVLVRRRSLGWGQYINYVYSPDGQALAFYRIETQELKWKLSFASNTEKIAYSYRDYENDWLIHVEIMELKP